MMRSLILCLVVFSSVAAFGQSSSRLAPAAPPKSPTPTGIIYPQDFGAKCDGVANDTAALRQAIAAADTPPYSMIQLPGTTCRFTDTLVFGGRTDRYSYISMQGMSEYASRLSYTGPADRAAILISHMSAFRWSSFSITGASRGSSIGVLLDGPFGSGGTMNTTITFDHLGIGGFHLGMLAGNEPGDAASEIECRNCRFDNNDIGWTASGYNSLNFWFYNVALTTNAVGMKVGGPWVTDAPHIVGGSSAGNTVADIECGNGFGALTIEHFRAEVNVGAKFLTGVYCGYAISLTGSSIVGVGSTATPIIDLDANFTHIDSSLVVGQIRIRNLLGTIGVQVTDTIVFEGSSGLPVVLGTVGGDGTSTQRLIFHNNMKLGTNPPKWFPEAQLVWNGSTLQ